TVPPKSTGKKRALQHGLLNISVVTLFIVAATLRVDNMPSAGTLALEAVAFGLLCTAGWMGGTLAYRNQIGVDHRYAGAGKWKEAIGVHALRGEGTNVIVGESN